MHDMGKMNKNMNYLNATLDKNTFDKWINFCIKIILWKKSHLLIIVFYQCSKKKWGFGYKSPIIHRLVSIHIHTDTEKT